MKKKEDLGFFPGVGLGGGKKTLYCRRCKKRTEHYTGAIWGDKPVCRKCGVNELAKKIGF